MEAFQASSIILVFVTILFGIRYPIIIKEITDEDIPNGELAKKREKKRIKHSFLINCLPLNFVLLWCSYLFIPIFIKILKLTHINLFNFDFLPTSFVFVAIWIWILTLWSICLSILFAKRIDQLNKGK